MHPQRFAPLGASSSEESFSSIPPRFFQSSSSSSLPLEEKDNCFETEEKGSVSYENIEPVLSELTEKEEDAKSEVPAASEGTVPELLEKKGAEGTPEGVCGLTTDDYLSRLAQHFQDFEI